MLLTEGKKALVVGGGKIATRKAMHLLESNMHVEIVSPNISTTIEKLSENENITIIKREFQKSDIYGKHLVFAATNDRKVNRKITNECHNSHILCCSCDGNWIDGDFITPAIYRDNELTLAISTDGKACRKSRIVKNCLSHQVHCIENAELFVLGTNHTLLSENELNSFKSNLDSTFERADLVKAISSIHEFMFLDTCNRVEFYALVSDSSKISKNLLRSLRFDTLDNNQFFIKKGFSAFKHLAKVTAGIKSDLPGEHHIVSQVKDALNISIKNNWANGTIKEWSDISFNLSKQIRNSSNYQQTSLVDNLLNYIENEITHPFNTIAILGTGNLGKSIYKSISNKFHNKQINWYYNSQKPSAIYNQACIKPISILNNEGLDEDLIITATSSSKYLINKNILKNPDNNKTLIDLSIPRNIDPILFDFNNVTLLTLADINKWFKNSNIIINQNFEEIILKNRELYEKIIHSFKDRQ